MKTCTRCKTDKPLTEFYASTDPKGGLKHASACKPCTRIRAAELKEAKGDYSQRWDRRRQGLATGTKWCPGCEAFLPQAQFAMRSYRGKQKADYRVSLCYPCAADHRKRWNHGIATQEYDAMLVAQDYRCASCRDPFADMKSKHINIDHCHGTGKIRGVLCNHCNLALGHLRDDRRRILALVDYLDAAA